VLHLGSRGGDAPGTFADAGAVVTALDESAELLDAARARRPSILWVEAASDALPPELRRGRFDLVYAPPGVVREVADLDGWARGVADALHARGELLVFEGHPVLECLEPVAHRWRGDYFGGVRRLGTIVTTVARAGFALDALEEYPIDRRLPGWFLLYARRRG
jgi:hypothetical protein